MVANQADKQKVWEVMQPWATSILIFAVGHPSFYAEMVLAEFGVCCRLRTLGSDPVLGGLPKGNVVELDLERKSQKAQPILKRGGNVYVWRYI